MKLENICGYKLSRMNRKMEKAVNVALSGDGITRSQATVLNELFKSEDGMCTMKELERSLGSAQSTVVGVVDRMEEKGLVETLPSKNDRRVRVIHITELGAQLHMQTRELYDAVYQQIFAPLTETELQILRLLLERLAPEEE